jgi:molybdate transport system permease protein
VAALGLTAVAAPIVALVVRADPTAVRTALASVEARQALCLSLRTALTATAICALLGLPTALVLARRHGRLVTIVRSVIALPLVLPPMVVGVALLTLLGRRGLLGPFLSTASINLPFTTAAVVVAQAFVAFPYLVIAVEGALRAQGTRFERAAAALGARPSRILWTVTLPLAAPALRAGLLLSFARALGEFGATALFAGNAAGTTRTMPLAIYTAFNGAGENRTTAVALSLLLLVTAIVILVASGTSRPAAGERRSDNRRHRPRRGDRPASTSLPARPVGHCTALPGSSAPGLGIVGRVAVQRGDFALDAPLAIAPGARVAVVGANGAGKSTLVEAVAGFLPLPPGSLEWRDPAVSASPSEARASGLVMGETIIDQARTAAQTDNPSWDDPDRNHSSQVPAATDPQARPDLPMSPSRLGYLSQDPAMFPHLTVRQGIAYGPRARGIPRRIARQIADYWLAVCDLTDCADQRGAELSGGQAARAGLARLFAIEPTLLLLDEPFAALDVTSAALLRDLLARLLADSGHTLLLVTHDLLDVALLTDQTIVLEAGRVVDDGPTSRVFGVPRCTHAAALAGVTLIDGWLDSTCFTAETGWSIHLPPEVLSDTDTAERVPARLLVPREACRLNPATPADTRETDHHPAAPTDDAYSRPDASGPDDLALLRCRTQVTAIQSAAMGIGVLTAAYPDLPLAVTAAALVDGRCAAGQVVDVIIDPTRLLIAKTSSPTL